MSNASLICLIVTAGIFLSLNPSTIAIFCALLAGSLGKGHSKLDRHSVAISFLLATFFFYTIVGSLVIIILNSLSHQLMQNVALIVGFAGVVWGIMNIKEYFWYGKHRDISIRLANTLHHKTVKKNDPVNAGVLGFIAAYAALPSVGIPLLALSCIITLTKPYDTTSMLALGATLIAPLIIIFILSSRGLKLSSILKWKEDSKGVFRLCIGLTTIIISWMLFLILNGSLGGGA